MMLIFWATVENPQCSVEKPSPQKRTLGSPLHWRWLSHLPPERPSQSCNGSDTKEKKPGSKMIKRAVYSIRCTVLYFILCTVQNLQCIVLASILYILHIVQCTVLHCILYTLRILQCTILNCKLYTVHIIQCTERFWAHVPCCIIITGLSLNNSREVATT